MADKLAVKWPLSQDTIGPPVENAHQIVLTPQQVKLIDFAGNMGRITNNDVVDILKIPDRIARRHLARLVNMGVFKAIGEKKARYYEVI